MFNTLLSLVPSAATLASVGTSASLFSVGKGIKWAGYPGAGGLVEGSGVMMGLAVTPLILATKLKTDVFMKAFAANTPAMEPLRKRIIWLERGALGLGFISTGLLFKVVRNSSQVARLAAEVEEKKRLQALKLMLTEHPPNLVNSVREEKTISSETV
jgi:hypothetical protein